MLCYASTSQDGSSLQRVEHKVRLWKGEKPAPVRQSAIFWIRIPGLPALCSMASDSPVPAMVCSTLSLGGKIVFGTYLTHSLVSVLSQHCRLSSLRDLASEASL